MGFLDHFKFKQLDDERKSTLQKSIEELLPGKDEKSYINYTSIAGLMARVAFADLNIDPGEENYMTSALTKWTDLSTDEASKITQIAISNMKTLIDLENHFYCSPLVEDFTVAERYNVVRVLFQLAASDGEVAGVESEEIRSINSGLKLTHQHYISARSEVSDKLSINKN